MIIDNLTGFIWTRILVFKAAV